MPTLCSFNATKQQHQKNIYYFKFLRKVEINAPTPQHSPVFVRIQWRGCYSLPHLSVYGFNGGDAIAFLTCLCPDSMEGMVLRSSPVRVRIQWRGCYSIPHLSMYRFSGGDAIAYLTCLCTDSMEGML